MAQEQADKNAERERKREEFKQQYRKVLQSQREKQIDNPKLAEHKEYGRQLTEKEQPPKETHDKPKPQPRPGPDFTRTWGPDRD